VLRSTAPASARPSRYYLGPLHFLTVREVVRALRAADPAPARVVDLGCGTGAAGAAWALAASPRTLLRRGGPQRVGLR
jgi:methylase of polypeptide subunit release factors